MRLFLVLVLITLILGFFTVYALRHDFIRGRQRLRPQHGLILVLILQAIIVAVVGRAFQNQPEFLCLANAIFVSQLTFSIGFTFIMKGTRRFVAAASLWIIYPSAYLWITAHMWITGVWL